MYITKFFFLLVVAGLVWNLVITIGIHNKLLYTNVAENMAVSRYAPWVRLAEYKKLTKAETGRTGHLYTHYVASVLLIGIAGAILIFLLVNN